MAISGLKRNIFQWNALPVELFVYAKFTPVKSVYNNIQVLTNLILVKL